MYRSRTWALVADGVRARILRNLDDAAPPADPPTELISQSRSQHLRDVMAGGLVETQSPRRDDLGSEPDSGADAIRLDMRDFADELLDRLNSHRRAGDFERLAIFAAPAMLDLLREQMPRSLRNAVILESGRNLVHCDEARLRAFVKKEIGSPGETTAG